MKERRFDIDNLKGILIFLVVFGHLILPSALKESGICYEIFTFIYFFHMPIFIFVSGLVTSEFKKDKILNYVFLYFLFNFSLAIFDDFLNQSEISFFEPYYSMWFLICIVFYRILVKFCKNTYLLFFLSIILSICISFSDLGNFLAISRVFVFLPFFLFGYILQQKKILQYKNNLSLKAKFITFILFFILIGILIFFNLMTNLSSNFYFMEKFSTNGESLYRVILVLVNLLLCISTVLIIPNKKLFFLSKIGKNSLNIYLIHRFIVLFIDKIFIEDYKRAIVSFSITIIICLILGSEYFNQKFRTFLNFLLNKQIYIYFFTLLYIFTINLNFTEKEYKTPLISNNLENCIKISYIGDLILFENDIYNAQTKNTYDFSNYFKETSDLFGDYTFGVLEGPISDLYYSTGNYNDNKLVSLNYPIEFLKEISQNIDFVTIGTNHLLDRDFKGLKETIQNLNDIGLDYTGGYISENDNKNIKIVNIEDLKVAVLSYTYGMNNDKELKDFMINEFNEKEIKMDIEAAQVANVDKIIVMSHIGTQFSHEKDFSQDYWNQFFASLGVDIVFSDHAHATQPIEFIKNTVIFNCPGNYGSSFSEFDGNYSAICNVYIDKDTLELVTTSIVPLSTNKKLNELITPVSCYDLNDITGFNIVCKSMIGKEFNYVLPEVFFNKNGYCTIPSNKIEKSDSVVFDFIDKDSICFIGDSITEGTRNDSHPWFESLNLKNEIHNISVGGATSGTIKELILKDTNYNKYDCYVIALGTNDIRYNALSAKDYISNLKEIITIIGEDKKYIIVSPWFFLNSDYVSIIEVDKKGDILKKYDENLKLFCNENKYLYINTYNYLEDFFKENKSSLYLVDYIHPNIKGIEIYSKAFLEGENNYNIIQGDLING